MWDPAVGDKPENSYEVLLDLLAVLHDLKVLNKETYPTYDMRSAWADRFPINGEARLLD